jgi:hypothetical protein
MREDYYLNISKLNLLLPGENEQGSITIRSVMRSCTLSATVQVHEAKVCVGLQIQTLCQTLFHIKLYSNKNCERKKTNSQSNNALRQYKLLLRALGITDSFSQRFSI